MARGDRCRKLRLVPTLPSEAPAETVFEPWDGTPFVEREFPLNLMDLLELPRHEISVVEDAWDRECIAAQLLKDEGHLMSIDNVAGLCQRIANLRSITDEIVKIVLPNGPTQGELIVVRPSEGDLA